MRHLIILFLFISLSSSAQEEKNNFWKNRCEIFTDGNGKSLGLKIKMYYPCAWIQEDGERPHIVKKFSYDLGLGKSLAQTIAIKQMETEPSKRELDELFSQAGLKKLVSSNATFISGRKVKIDGLDCGEIIQKINRESPVANVSSYLIYYYIIFKNKIITLAFATGASTEKDAKNLFNTYKLLFQDLATNTIILTKWE